jgi:hypothetical protein
MTDHAYLTEQELSERLKIPLATLRYQRSRPTLDTIPYIKIGRAIRYEWAVVQAFLKERTHAFSQDAP